MLKQVKCFPMCWIFFVRSVFSYRLKFFCMLNGFRKLKVFCRWKIFENLNFIHSFAVTYTFLLTTFSS